MADASRNVARRDYFRQRDAAKKARRAALRAGRQLQQQRREDMLRRIAHAREVLQQAREAQKPPPPPPEDGRTARFRWAREAVRELQEGRERLAAELAAFRQRVQGRAS